MNKSDNQKIIMTKDFENWIKQGDLLEYYQNNPDQQQTIFSAYKSEKEIIKLKDEIGLSDWMSDSPKKEWTDSDYLEMVVAIKKARENKIKELDDELSSIEPSEALAIIEKHLYGLEKREMHAEIEMGFATWTDWHDWYRKYLLCAKDYQQKRPSIKLPKQKNRTTYQWQGNTNKELPELYSLMINEYKLIASGTTLEQFTAIFTGQPTKNIKPIKWLNSNRLLAYFLDCAFSGQNWQSIAGNGKLFHNKTKSLTANDLSVAKKGYVDFGQPKDYEKIDLILKTIKKD